MKGRSCTTVLLNVDADLKLELDENSVAFLVFLDHNKAFDKVDHNSAGSLFFSYLLDRRQKVNLNENIQIRLILVEVFPRDQYWSCVYVKDLPDVLVDSPYVCW